MALQTLVTCVIAGIDYLVHPQILGSVEESVKADQIIPVLVLSEGEIYGGPEKLAETLQHYVSHDDVCSLEFTAILVMKPSGSGGKRTMTAISSVYHLQADLEAKENAAELPSGPYFLSGSNLHQAWKLYPDDLDAFTVGVIPENVGEPALFRPVASLSSQGVSNSVPVPSRHYHKVSKEKPLAGARLSLKDNFDVRGIKTTLSSKSWAELYPAANTSASYVEDLINLGAVIVGKTKMTQFATGIEWVDFQAPTNPRGDRYQDPSGSSAGAAASLAGYDWLDYAIGGDSGGGAGESATYQGLYSIRPSFGSASLEGIRINSSQYDAVGLFGRNLQDLLHIANETLDVPRETKVLPTRILYPVDFFPLPNSVHQDLMEDFVSVLERHLNVKRTEISLASEWGKTAHQKQGLQDYMAEAPFRSLCYDYYNEYDDFRSLYQETFDRQPFVEESPLFRWDMGAAVTEYEYEDYLERIDVFRLWFNENVMETGQESGFDTVMVLPYGIAEPKYRDARPSPPTAFEGIDPKLLSPILETPQIIVPFAQMPYYSRISNRKEYLPLCGSLMGAEGSDLTLIRLAKDAFESAGWRTSVDTGRFTFPVGQNSRNVSDDGDKTGYSSLTIQLAYLSS